MATSHGSKADFFANGYVLSSYLSSATASGSRDSADASTFGSTSKQYVPGLKDTTMTAEGIYDGASGAVDEILFAAIGGANGTGFVSYFPFGAGALGNIAFSMPVNYTSYEVNTDVGDVAQISAEFQAGINGRYARGLISHVLQAEVAGGNSSGLDNTAATANGGGLVVHATAASSLTVKLQDSADNTTWADVTGVLNMGSARGSARIETGGLTVRRYTRILWTGTGTFLTVTERY